MGISETEHGARRILIRRSSMDDLPHLVAISHAAAFAALWSEQQWRDIFHTQNPPRLAWTAWETSGGVVSSDVNPPVTGTAEAVLPEAPGTGRFEPRSAAPAPVGFLVAQCGGADWELENMAVLPAFRRHGAGSALLAALLAEAQARQAERILLEVRPSNEAAVRLYRQGGFELLARRPGYYRDPVEDALIMVHAL